MLSCAAAAQVTSLDAHSMSRASQRGLEIWTGRATHSSRWGFLGDTPNVNLALIAVRWTLPIKTTSEWVLEYTADVVPMALLSPPLPTRPGTETAAGRCDAMSCEVYPLQSTFPHGSSFGAGVSPLGLSWVLEPTARIRPMLATTGGLLWSDRKVPTTGAARVNFVATAEAGIRAALSGNTELTVAYRFHHLSNAGLARENPALASHLISLGVRVRQGGSR